MQARDLYQMQIDLVDKKVEVAVINKIEQVVEQIRVLEKKMDAKFDELGRRISNLENRMVAVETKLGMVNETQRELRNKLIDYGVKTIWLTVGAVVAYLGMHLQFIW